MSFSIEMRESFECSRKIEDAFDYIADFSKIEQWDHTVVDSKKTSAGAIGLHSEFDLVLSSGFRKVPIKYTITEYQRPARVVLTGVSDNFTAVDTVVLTKTADGCHVDWQAEVTFSGTLAKIAPLMAKRIKAEGAKTVKGLEQALADQFPAPQRQLTQTIGDKLILPGVFSFTRFGYQRARKNWRPVSANMANKHAVISGATSGLGKETALQLATTGARLTLVARDKGKAEAVRNEIVTATGNTDISIEIAELSEMSEVSALAARLLKQGRAIDVLVNNAGALLNPRQETSEGLEKSFALLLLSPFLLTEKLYPLLKLAGAARVINVASGGMYTKRISVSNLESKRGKYSGSEAYARAKRGLVISGEQWAERWQKDGITVHNMHPGWAYTPGVVDSLPEFTRLTRKVLRDTTQGADTIVWLACATEAGKTSGLFWLDRSPHTTHLSAKTRETAQQRVALRAALLDYIEKVTGESLQAH